MRATIETPAKKAGGSQPVAFGEFSGPPTDWVERGDVGEHAKPGPTPILESFANLKPRPLEWLWPGRIPLGSVTALLGPRGSGKSFLALDIAARVTRGSAWPDDPDTPQTCGAVLLLTGRDDRERLVLPRLLAAGADLDRVETLASGSASGAGRGFCLDLAALEAEARKRPNLRLIVIDPFVGFVGQANDRRTRDLVDLLKGLSHLADRLGVAVVLVNATDKGSNGRTWQHGVDVLPAIQAEAPTVWAVESDPDRPSCGLLLPSLIHLSADPGGLRFRIDRKSGRVAWGQEAVALHAGVLGGRGRAVTGVSRASRWLRDVLSEGPRPAREVLQQGAMAGHSRGALYAAKDRLGVDSVKQNDRFAGSWSWALPLAGREGEGADCGFGRWPGAFEDPDDSNLRRATPTSEGALPSAPEVEAAEDLKIGSRPPHETTSRRRPVRDDPDDAKILREDNESGAARDPARSFEDPEDTKFARYFSAEDSERPAPDIGDGLEDDVIETCYAGWGWDGWMSADEGEVLATQPVG
jgi:hypothetical protein